MKYTVRSQEGQLEYESFGQVEEAWLMGLVEPDDEILEEGKTMWRKASSFPLLANARRHGDSVWRGTWFLWTIIGIAGATFSLSLMQTGGLENQIIGGIIAIITATTMFQVNMRARRRSRPHQ